MGLSLSDFSCYPPSPINTPISVRYIPTSFGMSLYLVTSTFLCFFNSYVSLSLCLSISPCISLSPLLCLFISFMALSLCLYAYLQLLSCNHCSLSLQTVSIFSIDRTYKMYYGGAQKRPDAPYSRAIQDSTGKVCCLYLALVVSPFAEHRSCPSISPSL